MTDTRSADVARLLEHRAWVRALAGRLLGDPNAVDDVEQDTWVAALRGGPSEPRALRSWLGSVASRFALQRLRGDGRRARRETAAAGDRIARAPDEIVAEADAHGRVVQAVLALDEPYRSAVLLRYFEGLAIADVASRTGVPVETVRTRLRRAHERLRRALGDDSRAALAILVAPVSFARTGAASPAVPAGGGPRTTLVVAAASACVVVAVVVAAWALAPGGVVARSATDGAVPLAARGEDGASPGPGAAPGAVDATDGRAAVPVAPRDGDPAAPGPAERQVAADGEGVPKGAPPAPTAPAPARLRDLADGAPLPGVALEIRRAGAGPERVTTGSDGTLSAAVGDGDDVTVPGTEWTLVRLRARTADGPSDLWAHRTTTVRGVVRATGRDAILRDVRITVAAGTMDSRADVAAGRPDAMALFEIFGALRDVRVGDDGRFEVRVPVVRDTRVSASARGFRSKVVALDLAPGRAARPLEIVLEPAPAVRGRVRTPDGTPLRGVRVQVHVVRRGRAADLSAAEILGTGGSTAGGPPHGFTVTRSFDATTDVRGLFDVLVPAEGATFVVVHVAGHRRARLDLGNVVADVSGIDLVAEPASGTTVVLRHGGAPLASASVLVQDLDRSTGGWSWATDAAGRARTDWLEPGREYVVLGLGSNDTRRLRWDGAATIDLDALPPDESKGGFWGHGAALAAPDANDGGAK